MSAARFSARVTRLSDPYAPPQSARKPRLDLRDVVPDFSELYPKNIGSYPKTAALAEAIAGDLQLNAAQVAVTAGGDDALFQIIMAAIEPGKNLVVAAPTFPMIARYVTIAGGEIRTVVWLAGDFPVDEFTRQIDDNTAVILFVSPNNPTGRTVPFEMMQSVRAAALHAWMVLDAVYIEFADNDITRDFLALPRSLVVRSFSKAYGAAGLRLGYALSNQAELLLAMRKVGQPYGVSMPSLEMGFELLALKAKVLCAIEAIKNNRTILLNVLRQLGWDAMPSEANFVFINCGAPDVARNVFEAMDQRGITIRFFPNDPLIAGYIRIGVPYRDDDLQFLVSALKELKS